MILCLAIQSPFIAPFPSNKRFAIISHFRTVNASLMCAIHSEHACVPGKITCQMLV